MHSSSLWVPCLLSSKRPWSVSIPRCQRSRPDSACGHWGEGTRASLFSYSSEMLQVRMCASYQALGHVRVARPLVHHYLTSRVS